MTFAVPGEAYDRFMGRYSEPLADRFVALLGLEEGQLALDVGAGTGALTARLVAALGAGAVHAVDPSPSFVDALRARFPDVDVYEAPAERLPLADRAVDVAAAQLVVNFLPDPVAGLREIARVVRDGGLVAACLWDFAGGRAPLSVFWAAARDVDPGVPDEAQRPIAQPGALRELFVQAGLRDPTEHELAIAVRSEDFDAWWRPYTEGVGPAGEYLRTLDDEHRAEVRRRALARTGSGPFVVDAVSIAVTARA